MYGYGFLSRALVIGVKFYMAIRPHLRQVLSDFGEDSPEMVEFWASTGPYGGICFLLKHLFYSVCAIFSVVLRCMRAPGGIE